MQTSPTVGARAVRASALIGAALVGFSSLPASGAPADPTVPVPFAQRNGGDDNKDHPLAAQCRAAPQSCVCAVERELDCIDTPAGRPAYQKCVADVTKGNVRTFRGSHAELVDAAKDHCRKRLGGRTCGAPTCLRWAGRRDDLGAAAPRGPWIRWRVFESVDPALQPKDACGFPPALLCSSQALPGGQPCQIRVRDEELARVFYERVEVGQFAAAEGVPAAEFKSGRAANFGGRTLVRKGRWLEWDLDTPKGGDFDDSGEEIVHQGEYEVAASSTGPVSRKSGTWLTWRGTTPSESATYRPAGPTKEELLDGPWTSFGWDGKLERHGSYSIYRDDVADTLYSAKVGLWRVYSDGALSRVEYYSPPATEQDGDRRVGRIQREQELELFRSGRPRHYAELRYDGAKDWSADGLDLTWSPRGRLVRIFRNQRGVILGEGFQLGAQSVADLPWADGELMGQVRGLVMPTDRRFWKAAGIESREGRYRRSWGDGDSEADDSPRRLPRHALEVASDLLKRLEADQDGEPNEYDDSALSSLDQWLTVVETLTDPSLGGASDDLTARLASPTAECMARKPVENRSRAFCTDDTACAAGETCDVPTNVCVTRWDEGWRRDRWPPFCDGPAPRLAMSGSDKWVQLSQLLREQQTRARVEVRWTPSGDTSRINCYLGSITPFTPSAPDEPTPREGLLWSRTGDAYDTSSLDSPALAPAAGNADAAWNERACLSLPLPSRASAADAWALIAKRVLRRGLDQWLAPVVTQPEPPPVCSNAANDPRDRWQMQSIDLEGMAPACIPLLARTHPAASSVARDVTSQWLSSCHRSDGPPVRASVTHLDDKLLAMAVDESPCTKPAPLLWSLSDGRALTFADVFVKSVAGARIGTLLTGTSAPAPTAACKAARGKGAAFVSLRADADRTLAVFGETFTDGKCNWSFERPLSELRAQLTPGTPVAALAR